MRLPCFPEISKETLVEDQNPYSAPEADIDTAPDNTEEVQKIISGQKLILYAILVNIGANILGASVPGLALVAFVVAGGMAITGLAKVGTGLGYHIATIVVLSITMILPLINLIVLLVVNSKATARIREAGYKVGLMGAKL